MSIQSSVNSIINQAAAVSTISKVAKEGKEIKEALKEGSKDIGRLVDNVSKEQVEAEVGRLQEILNPNLRDAILSARDKEGFSSPQMKDIITKHRQKVAMMERAETLSKQKQDVPKIKEELIRLGKEKIDPTSPLYQKIMSQMEERDGK